MHPELGWQPSKEWHFLQVNCHKHYEQELQKQCCKGTFHYKELLQGNTKILFLAFCKSKNSCSLLYNLRDISLFTNCFDQRPKGSRTKNRQETDHLKALAYLHEKKFICKTSSTYHQLTK